MCFEKKMLSFFFLVDKKVEWAFPGFLYSKSPPPFLYVQCNHSCYNIFLTPLHSITRSVQDLYSTLNASPHRLSFLGMFLALVAAVFCFGTICGRVTKRAR